MDPGDSPPERLRVLHLAAAWLVVALVVGLFMEKARAQALASEDVGVEASTPVAPGPMDEQLLAAQVAVGLRALGQTGAVDVEQVLDQVAAAAEGPVEHWRSAAVAGELLGAEAGRERLAAIQMEDQPELAMDVALLYQIYLDGAEAVADDGRQHLRRRHAWFADLALSHGLDDDQPLRRQVEQRALRTAITLSVMSVGLIALLVGGMVCAGFALQRWRTGRLRAAYQPGAATPASYVSGFALYLLSYLGFSAVIYLLVQSLPGLRGMWLLWLFPLLFTPLLLLWLRHLGRQSTQEALYAMGLHRGRGLWREAGAGVLGYLAGIPLVALGFLITALLASGGHGIDHPVMDELRGDSLAIIGALLLAAVFAPLVEETMFRGVLYHHLRSFYGPPLSALIQGLVFAAVHPQGLAGIPVLAALGIVFAFIREWRGSLVGPMVAHGLHNAVTVILAILLLS